VGDPFRGRAGGDPVLAVVYLIFNEGYVAAESAPTRRLDSDVRLRS